MSELCSAIPHDHHHRGHPCDGWDCDAEPDSMPCVYEVTPEEGRQLFENLCQDRFEVSAEEFLTCREHGLYPSHWSHDDIVSTEICIPFWGSA